MVLADNRSVAARYEFRLRNQKRERVAYIDDYVSFNWAIEVSGVGSYALSLKRNSPHIGKFQLDNQLIVTRSVPGCDLAPYQLMTGLHRKFTLGVASDGTRPLASEGFNPNHLLARTTINYKSGTIFAVKEDIPAESAMKQYVEENCGLSATVGKGRESNGVLPYFFVDPDNKRGPLWSGDKSFENLLDTLLAISSVAKMDFDVEYVEAELAKDIRFQFHVYDKQLGKNRTDEGLDPHTGKNKYGLAPVIIAVPFGNISDMTYVDDRSAEANVIAVLGDGEGAIRDVLVRQTLARNSSPWNRCEISRPQSGFQSQRESYGDEVLAGMIGKESFTFTPLQLSTCLFGKHYFLGDVVTIVFENIKRNKRIVKVTGNISSPSSGEVLAMEFSE